MKDIGIALLTTFLTVISGVLVYILSEFVKEKVLMPLHEYKELRSKVYFSLILYAREISSPLDEQNQKNQKQEIKESYQKAADEFRVFAAELAKVNRELFWLTKEKKEQNEKAWHNLIGLSNCFFLNRGNDSASGYCEEIKSWLF